MIPLLGDILVAGIGWPLVLLAGLVMAVILVGLVGWPLMYATISAEGSDSFDALSRSYSYVYQCPWHYLWYCAVAAGLRAVVVFFVGFMGSLMVYLGKWGVAQTPWHRVADRDPSFLFVYAPESFGWRTLLLEGEPRGRPESGRQRGDNVPAYENLAEHDAGTTRSAPSWFRLALRCSSCWSSASATAISGAPAPSSIC